MDVLVGRFPAIFRTSQPAVLREGAGEESGPYTNRTVKQQTPHNDQLYTETQAVDKSSSSLRTTLAQAPVNIKEASAMLCLVTICVSVKTKCFCPGKTILTSDFLFKKCYLLYLICAHMTPLKVCGIL